MRREIKERSLCFPVLLPPMSLHCSSNQLAVAVLSWRGCTSMGAEGGINKLVRWGEKNVPVLPGHPGGSSRSRRRAEAED